MISQPLRDCSEPAAAAVSDDGRWLVTICGNALWMSDVTNGKAVSPLLRHEARISAGAFSSDGRMVVTGSTNGKAQVWDVAGQRIIAALQHQGEVYSAAFDPTNSLVVTASDARLRVWNVSNGRPIGDPIEDPEARSVAFRSGRMVTALANGTLRVWDTKTGRSVGEPVPLGGPIRSAAFSLDGSLVVTVSADGKTTRVWDTIDGKSIGPPIHHDVEVGSAAVSPQGRRVITTSSNGQATLWHVGSARIIGRLNGIGAAAFSPDGRQVMIVTEPTAVGFSYVLAEGPEDVPLLSGMLDRVWGFFRGPSKNVALLADLAEVVSGFAEDKAGANVLVEDPVSRLDKLRSEVADATEGDEIRWFVRWFLADRCERFVSPLSVMGVRAQLQRPAEAGEDPASRISCAPRR